MYTILLSDFYPTISSNHGAKHKNHEMPCTTELHSWTNIVRIVANVVAISAPNPCCTGIATIGTLLVFEIVYNVR